MKKSFLASFIFLAIILLLPVQSNAQKFKGLALTPPMGWNSWNHFACNVDEKIDP